MQVVHLSNALSRALKPTTTSTFVIHVNMLCNPLALTYNSLFIYISNYVCNNFISISIKLIQKFISISIKSIQKLLTKDHQRFLSTQGCRGNWRVRRKAWLPPPISSRQLQGTRRWTTKLYRSGTSTPCYESMVYTPPTISTVSGNSPLGHGHISLFSQATTSPP